MSAYSLAHVLDVPGWPTVWPLVESSGEPLKHEIEAIQEELLTISARLRRLQGRISS